MKLHHRFEKFDDIPQSFYDANKRLFSHEMKSNFLGGYWMLTTMQKQSTQVQFNPFEEYSSDVFGRQCAGRRFDWIWKNNNWCNLCDSLVATDETASSDFANRSSKTKKRRKKKQKKRKKKRITVSSMFI